MNFLFSGRIQRRGGWVRTNKMSRFYGFKGDELSSNKLVINYDGYVVV